MSDYCINEKRMNNILTVEMCTIILPEISPLMKSVCSLISFFSKILIFVSPLKRFFKLVYPFLGAK